MEAYRKTVRDELDTQVLGERPLFREYLDFMADAVPITVGLVTAFCAFLGLALTGWPLGCLLTGLVLRIWLGTRESNPEPPGSKPGASTY
jgi:hypothetical protein